MLRLSNITDKIQVVLAGNITANQLQCFSTWKDFTSTTCAEGRNLVNTNNTTDVDIVPAPEASTSREIDYLSVFNTDTASATVTVKYDANGTEVILAKAVIAPGEKIEYNDRSGFHVKDTSGGVKNANYFNSGVAVANVLNTVVLSGDVVNNNGTANTIADVTGLSFDVSADYVYWFEFVIPYTSAATTTGSRWAINGPGSPTMLNMRSEYTLTATTTTVNSVTAYDIPAASNASSLTTGNVATMWGIIKPSQAGTVIARFASEISASAITAKAGATLRWMRII